MGLLVGESDSKGKGFLREQNGLICVMTGYNLYTLFPFFSRFWFGVDSFHLAFFLFLFVLHLLLLLSASNICILNLSNHDGFLHIVFDFPTYSVVFFLFLCFLAVYN